MVNLNQPIKLQNNLSLYSGDIITINNSNSLLVEVISNSIIKLRAIESDKYLVKHKIRGFFSNSLKLAGNFEEALIFAVRNNNGKISLVTDGKFLDWDGKDKKFRLLSEEKWLTITKQENIKNIANYQETAEISQFQEKDLKKVKTEESLIAHKFYDNKSSHPLKVTCSFSEFRQTEHKFAWSTNFTWGVLTNLKLSYPSVAEIGVEGKFEKTINNSQEITETVNKSIQESSEATCSPWGKLKCELKAYRNEYIIPYIAQVKRTIGERTYEYLVEGNYTYDNYSDYRISHQEINIKNILIVGWTGSGKSTLSNVLSQSNDFLVSNKSTSGTKHTKSSKEFKWQENYYRVIDNIGFGDAKIDEREVMIRIGDAIHSARQGLSHALFVFSGRFSDQEKESLQKLVALKIANRHITLIRSKFDNFGNEEECQKDREMLENESKEVGQLINNCRRLLYINNEEEDDKEDSRKIVLDHLHSNCPNIFKPKEWENIASLIDNYFAEKEKLEKQKEEVGVVQQEIIEQQIDDLKTATAEQVREKIQSNNEMKEFAELIQVPAKGTN